LSGEVADKTVIVTRALARRQWQREFQKLSDVRPVILTGKTPHKIDASATHVIIGWECLPAWIGTLIAWRSYGTMQVIYDEIHRAKNWRRWEKTIGHNGRPKWGYANNISGSSAKLATYCTRRLGLSATPAPNSLEDLYSALDLLEPGCWGTGLEWKKRYCAAREGKFGGWVADGKSNIYELQDRLKWVVHKVPAAEVKRSLPPMRRQLCYLSREDQSKAAGFKDDFKRASKLGKQALFEMKLMEAAARKRKWLIEIVEENVAAGQKVVVFTGRKKDCEQLADSIGKRCAKLNAPLWWGHGGVSSDDRDAMVQAYSSYDKGGCCLVGTTNAFGEAFDGLQHTDLAIMALIPWTPGMVEQAEGRFHRKGSDRAVLIMYAICEGTVDEHIADLLLNKLENLNAALNHTEAQDIADVLSGVDDEDAIVSAIMDKMGG
jgi:SNF2 family DNA or RNA helicase